MTDKLLGDLSIIDGYAILERREATRQAAKVFLVFRVIHGEADFEPTVHATREEADTAVQAAEASGVYDYVHLTATTFD